VKPSQYLKIFIGSACIALLFIVLAPTTPYNPIEAKEIDGMEFSIPYDNYMFQIGEELQYNVSYSIFDIGLVKMQVLDTLTKNGVKIFKAKAYLDSYSGLPFVDLHQVFYSEMDIEAFSQFFISHTTTKPQEVPYSKYFFDYKNNKVTFQFGVEPKGIIKESSEEPITDKQLDGLSLFYYARNNFRQMKKYSIPVFVTDKSYKTNFNFMNKLGSQEIDAVKYPIETIEFDGSSDFTGVYGLTGYFRGFFSNDDAGIPIVAKMKVILGSVHIELIKWTRPGWVPPMAQN
jgi:hypothetical protein